MDKLTNFADSFNNLPSYKKVNQFAKQLKILRNTKALTQKELAARLGVVRRTISHWENGTRECCFEMLIRLSSFFNVTIDQMLGVKEK